MPVAMIDLSAEEQRVLGALIEKQYVTPDVYPLTMNALLSACNQVSNRNPVVSYDEATVHRALDSLREKGLLRIVYSPSNRATKYRHVLDEAHRLERAECAVLCVLLLRGPQTVGELRTRTERMHPFSSLGDVEQTLDGLASRPDDAMAARMERQAGQKEVRYCHLLGPAPAEAATAEAVAVQPAASDDEVARLRADLDQLRREFDALRDQLM
ncbi:MAG: uncharacterized protein QOK43_1773 [Acidimicrobiaceae bacterium]|nr:uncharacterized protein [Acidimicrobiaceae bacterium]